MEHLAEVTRTIALTMGVAWAAGLNLYAAILVLGVLGASGSMDLPAGLEIVAHPLVIFAAALMYVVEFVADKVPGVDTAWDGIHTFVRIPAGALLAAEAVGNVDPAVSMAAALLGGAVSATTHAAKAGTRVLVNTSPEPFSNGIVSIAENAAVFGGLYLATTYPIAFLVLFVAMCAFAAWFLPRLWRGVVTAFRRLGSLLRGQRMATAGAPTSIVDEDQRPTV
ncbi:MAG TPA: DUF4126 domain-containing protein [Candidatus Limnocylindrales bacterium]|nr:DUF4126 domain-containing protein [Candidatus Limnocylindrales bacterium]